MVLRYTYKAIHNIEPSCLNCLINVSKPVRTTHQSTIILNALNRNVESTFKMDAAIILICKSITDEHFKRVGTLFHLRKH